MLETHGGGDLPGIVGTLPGTIHGITALGDTVHGMDLPGVGADSTARGIIAHGMARHGVGVVITEVIMEATTDITIIGEEVTDMPTIHLLTSTCQMAVRLLDAT